MPESLVAARCDREATSFHIITSVVRREGHVRSKRSVCGCSCTCRSFAVHLDDAGLKIGKPFAFKVGGPSLGRRRQRAKEFCRIYQVSYASTCFTELLRKLLDLNSKSHEKGSLRTLALDIWATEEVEALSSYLQCLPSATGAA